MHLKKLSRSPWMFQDWVWDLAGWRGGASGTVFPYLRCFNSAGGPFENVLNVKCWQFGRRDLLLLKLLSTQSLLGVLTSPSSQLCSEEEPVSCPVLFISFPITHWHHSSTSKNPAFLMLTINMHFILHHFLPSIPPLCLLSTVIAFKAN